MPLYPMKMLTAVRATMPSASFSCSRPTFSLLFARTTRWSVVGRNSRNGPPMIKPLPETLAVLFLSPPRSFALRAWVPHHACPTSPLPSSPATAISPPGLIACSKHLRRLKRLTPALRTRGPCFVPPVSYLSVGSRFCFLLLRPSPSFTNSSSIFSASPIGLKRDGTRVCSKAVSFTQLRGSRWWI